MTAAQLLEGVAGYTLVDHRVSELAGPRPNRGIHIVITTWTVGRLSSDTHRDHDGAVPGPSSDPYRDHSGATGDGGRRWRRPGEPWRRAATGR